MREGIMKTDEMDEPHPYMGRVDKSNMEPIKDFYPLGDLDFKPQSLKMIRTASVPQLAEEARRLFINS